MDSELSSRLPLLISAQCDTFTAKSAGDLYDVPWTRADAIRRGLAESFSSCILVVARFRAADKITVPLDIFNQPPRHAVLRDWLGPDMVARLLDYVRVNAHALEDTEVGAEEDSKVNPETRRSRRLASLGEFETQFEDRLREVLPDIFARLGTPPFAPISFELELVAHGDGAFFTRHIDTYTGRGTRDRVISGVYYFHRQPKAFSGGELRLYALAKGGQTAAFVDVQPDNDTLACFPSWFPHEVLPVRCPSGRLEDSRFAVNCWVLRG